MDWLSDAGRRISESTQRPSMNTVTAEQQLGQLLSLVHEFTAHRGRFQDLEKHCSGVDQQSISELVRQFERLHDSCHVGLERQRRLFKGINPHRFLSKTRNDKPVTSNLPHYMKPKLNPNHRPISYFITNA